MAVGLLAAWAATSTFLIAIVLVGSQHEPEPPAPQHRAALPDPQHQTRTAVVRNRARVKMYDGTDKLDLYRWEKDLPTWPHPIDE